MKVKLLAEDVFNIVAAMDGDECPAEEFLTVGEKTTQANRDGLLVFLKHTAQHGLQGIPAAWWREVDKQNSIYEFKKGSLRLFFFKGSGKDIAICTVGGRKKGQKVDKSAVTASINWKKSYVTACSNGTYEVIENEDQ